MRRRNVAGRRVAYLRSEQNISQDMLIARLQILGLKITRDVLANMESGRTRISDWQLEYFQKALRVPINMFFSIEVRHLDVKFSRPRAEKLKGRSRNGKN